MLRSALRRRETWLLKVFENRVLRKIFRPRSREVTKDGRKLRNAGVKCIKKLHDLYSLPKTFSGEYSGECDQLRKMRRRRMWRELRRSEMQREFWCGNPKQKRIIFRPRLRIKDDIKTDLKEHYRRFESGLSGSAKAHTTAVLNRLMRTFGFKKCRDFLV